MRGGILARSRQVGAKRALLFVDDDAARAGLHTAILIKHSLNLLFGQSILENFSIFIVTDGAEVCDLFFDTLVVEHVVCGARRIKGCTAWNELYTLHLEQFWIESLLGLIGEAGATWWQFVFFEKCLVLHVYLDVEQWVLNNEN